MRESMKMDSEQPEGSLVIGHTGKKVSNQVECRLCDNETLL